MNDVTELALKVGEIHTGVKTILENQAKNDGRMDNHEKRLKSLESNRWNRRVLFGGIMAAGLAALKGFFHR